ncbi:3-oxoacyl-reductase [Tothia fuscella]|uniref:3-oxoacyl-reductase n=1 Tax=Tothia fuscella TaxID=1048955 RepID=A0A9P4TW05_9PEZI|nr:3-oxoacyl-reductase [Tothia fuscella]
MATLEDLKISSLFSFNNHIVLVTGGATGLGEMAASGFVANGARVIIASRKEKELRNTNLSNKAGCDALTKEVQNRTNRLTVLLNNSGISWRAAYEDFPQSAWDKVMAVNVKSIFHMTVGFVSGLSTADVTSGDEGGVSAPGAGPFSYGPSKAACTHLSKMQASKLAPLNIMVYCICPGLFPSRMSNYGIQNHGDAMLARQPTGRIGGPPDFDGLVLFLSSAASAHMTGNVLEIDGGSLVSGWRRSVTSSQSKI